ncbi:hypothetical protein [Desulfogranum marinum]|uniref:sulfotransferase family protein n=1 Tax=Desulfogranum marinum TaxID=453220 RepID=UPI0029C9661D|nr:hypothetical protein [Desulfogranum marinum]
MSGKTCIFVLGMHRSGTSALTGLLNTLGVELGEKLLSPLVDNPKGFFENQRVYDLNERFIQQCGFRWDDPFFFGQEWLEEKTTTLFKEEIKQFLEKEFQGASLFSIKDPRISILFPLWREACEGSDILPVCILPIRHPVEVAKSLQVRNGFSLNKGINLWMNHTLAAEKNSRGCRRVFLSFNQLVNEPECVVEQLIEVFRLDDVIPDDYLERARGFVDKKLKHHDSENFTEGFGAGLVDQAVDLFFAMCEQGEQRISILKFDKIRKQYNTEKDFFLFQDFKQVMSAYYTYNDLERELQVCRDDNVEVRRRLEELSKEKNDLLGEVEKLQNNYEQAAGEVELMKSTAAWRIAEKLRRIRNLLGGKI